VIEPVFLSGLIFLFVITDEVKAQQLKFRAEVKDINVLEEIPSASGMELLNDKIYIVGDDSPFLFELNNNAHILRMIDIFDHKKLINSRMSNKHKPDFEAVTIAPWGKDDDILVFGSGSVPRKREVMVRIDFDDDVANVKEYNLSKFYKHLRKKAGIEKDNMNIEGAAWWNDRLLLLNRGDNTLFMIDYEDFVDYMKDDDKDKPNVEAISYQLPVLNGITARFSGACLLPDEDMLLFTASVENTPNWIIDGEILGSYLGILDLNQTQNTVPVCKRIMHLDSPFKEKVESIVILDKNHDMVNMLGVTDNDNGTSLLIEMEFSIEK